MSSTGKAKIGKENIDNRDNKITAARIIKEIRTKDGKEKEEITEDRENGAARELAKEKGEELIMREVGRELVKEKGKELMREVAREEIETRVILGEEVTIEEEIIEKIGGIEEKIGEVVLEKDMKKSSGIEREVIEMRKDKGIMSKNNTNLKESVVKVKDEVEIIKMDIVEEIMNPEEAEVKEEEKREVDKEEGKDNNM